MQVDNLKEVMKSQDFIARVVHNNYEQWKQEMESYLLY